MGSLSQSIAESKYRTVSVSRTMPAGATLTLCLAAFQNNDSKTKEEGFKDEAVENKTDTTTNRENGTYGFLSSALKAVTSVIWINIYVILLLFYIIQAWAFTAGFWAEDNFKSLMNATEKGNQGERLVQIMFCILPAAVYILILSVAIFVFWVLWVAGWVVFITPAGFDSKATTRVPTIIFTAMLCLGVGFLFSTPANAQDLFGQ